MLSYFRICICFEKEGSEKEGQESAHMTSHRSMSNANGDFKENKVIFEHLMISFTVYMKPFIQKVALMDLQARSARERGRTIPFLYKKE